MRFLKSLKYAFRGIVYCINNERNMRIHTVMALYVFAFSFFFHLSRSGYAILFLTFATVITAELFNTVAEELSDMAAASFNPVVRIIKDMASGAVLVCTSFSIGIGICLFWKPEAFGRIVCFYVDKPVLLILLFITILLSVIYILMGPIGIRDFIAGKKNGN